MKRKIRSEESEVEESIFYDFVYGAENVEQESSHFVDVKMRELEREMDKLSDQYKHAYFIALEQEIKQRTHYVRSKEFLLFFLHADGFDIRKAAMRMAKFFKYKLDLFGPEKLPRRIRQSDLSKDDKVALSSGFIHCGGLDCGGRVVLHVQRERLRSSGVLNEHFAKSISRATFYQIMHAFEEHPDTQSKGLVGVFWGLNCSLALKEYRILFTSNIKMSTEAMPIKVAGLHHCINNVIQHMCVSWGAALIPKHQRDRILFHTENSAADILSELSKYGINVDSLPVTSTGDYKVKQHQKQLESMREKEELSLSTKELQPVASKCLSQHPVPNSISTMAMAEENLPLALMFILDHNATPNAIWWSRNGTAFAIEKDIFPQAVLPQEFNGIKFDSFLRRLRRWGFQRLSNKREGNLNYVEYQHRLFQRNSPHLLEDWDKIPRKDKFPLRLRKAIESDEAAGCIWWINDGKAFAIEKDMFSLNVLEQHFEGLKFDSFYRLLKRWGFKRLAGQEKYAGNVVLLHHEKFQKHLQLTPEFLKVWTDLFTIAQQSHAREETFSQKLNRILANKEANHAIWWLDNCNTFAINEIEFSRDVLPKEYNGIKFASFKRSLKRWGFQRLKTSGDITIFQHSSSQNHPLETSSKRPKVSISGDFVSEFGIALK